LGEEDKKARWKGEKGERGCEGIGNKEKRGNACKAVAVVYTLSLLALPTPGLGWEEQPGTFSFLGVWRNGLGHPTDYFNLPGTCHSSHRHLKTTWCDGRKVAGKLAPTPTLANRGGLVFEVKFGGVWGGDNIPFFAQLLRN
jgi:hypothetical protein